MGKEKTVVQGQTTQQTQATPTAEETALNKLQLEQAQAFDPTQRQMNQNAGDVVNALLTGNSGANGAPQLQGYNAQAAAGINPEVTQMLVNQSLRDMNVQLAKSGAGTFMESGAAQTAGVRTAGDIRMGAEEFNIGNWLNLLNLGVGGQAQVQQPTLATSSMLGGRLAGLRTTNTTGTSNQTTIGMNPFMKSFQTSLGGTLGNPTAMFSPHFGFGGGK